MLILGNNNLSGVIPECWEKWQRLSVLNMRGNKLEGKLPVCLMSLTDLEILELSDNELSGSILSWVGTKLSSLKLLNLRSNKFDGKIPHEICYLTHIQVLDLSNNKLTGDIPQCFNNFSVLSGKETISGDPFLMSAVNKDVFFSVPLVMKGHEYMYNSILKFMMLLDLSSNKLIAYIPSELTTLIKLKSLNLSRNNLTGTIPEKIGDLKELESFDLSLNKLSGELPMSLSSLNSLSSFTVSYNKLTGRIPSSTQLQGFNESCFVGNKLCGDPLMSEPCSRVKTPADNEEADGSYGVDWGLIISVVSGFVVGFWVILVPLIVSRSWRIAYFCFLNEFRSTILLTVITRLPMIVCGLGATNGGGSLGYFPVAYKGGMRSILSPEAVLHGGHTGVVRSVLPSATIKSGINQTQGIFGWTGGEDGCLCCWLSDASSDINHSWISTSLVEKNTKKSKKNRHRPY